MRKASAAVADTCDIHRAANPNHKDYLRAKASYTSIALSLPQATASDKAAIWRRALAEERAAWEAPPRPFCLAPHRSVIFPTDSPD